MEEQTVNAIAEIKKIIPVTCNSVALIRIYNWQGNLLPIPVFATIVGQQISL
jgi:hypothetical protein